MKITTTNKITNFQFTTGHSIQEKYKQILTYIINNISQKVLNECIIQVPEICQCPAALKESKKNTVIFKNYLRRIIFATRVLIFLYRGARAAALHYRLLFGTRRNKIIQSTNVHDVNLLESRCS